MKHAARTNAMANVLEIMITAVPKELTGANILKNVKNIVVM